MCTFFPDNLSQSSCIPQHYAKCTIIPGRQWSLSKDVFERRTSIGSEDFSLFICLDANKFVLLSFFCLPESFNQSLPRDAKSPLPVEVRRSKTLLLKLPDEKLKPKRFKATDVKQK